MFHFNRALLVFSIITTVGLSVATYFVYNYKSYICTIESMSDTSCTSVCNDDFICDYFYKFTSEVYIINDNNHNETLHNATGSCKADNSTCYNCINKYVAGGAYDCDTRDNINYYFIEYDSYTWIAVLTGAIISTLLIFYSLYRIHRENERPSYETIT